MTEKFVLIYRFKYISIHTFLAEGDKLSVRIILQELTISIHTFLAEGDSSLSLYFFVVVISIHTFLAEGDLLIEYIIQ